ncbi:MAG: type IV pilus assembly protein PilM [Magnetococcales bacterium]|nr:type IV pilus assembly protein PilM [Magnetococcales bacterium]
MFTLSTLLRRPWFAAAVPHRPLVGIDIGASAVKVAEMERLGKGWRLRYADCHPLPPEAVNDGQIKQPDTVLQALQTLLDRHAQHSKNAAFSLSGSAVITKKIHMAPLSELELEEQIALEAEEYIPFEIQDVNLDFHIISRQDDNMEVLLVACKKELIESHAALIRQAGLQPLVCDLDLLALINAWQTFVPGNPATMLVNMGASMLNVAIVSADGQPGYIRDHALGSRQMIQELQSRCECPFPAAEQLLIMTENPTQNQVVNTQRQEIIATFLEQLLQQLRQALQFYKAASPEQPVSRILLAGGAALLPAAATTLQERLQLPVTVWDPLAGLSPLAAASATPCAAPRYAIALGLALRGERQ